MGGVGKLTISEYQEKVEAVREGRLLSYNLLKCTEELGEVIQAVLKRKTTVAEELGALS